MCGLLSFDLKVEYLSSFVVMLDVYSHARNMREVKYYYSI
jgi:hypothetical protein